jgi:KaiC/GvpD/RAD55 family RecA-like ATPase
VDSSSESEPELIVTVEEEEEEALKNAALSSIKQDKAVDTLEEAAKKLDLASEPMTH